MKRVGTLLMVCFLAGITNIALIQAQPKIVFDKTEHNFGSFKESAGFKLLLSILPTRDYSFDHQQCECLMRMYDTGMGRQPGAGRGE